MLDVPAALSFKGILSQVSRRTSLDEDEAQAAFGFIMDGGVSEIEIAAFLTALKVRGETTDELFGAARAMRMRMLGVPDAPADAIDVCGTGGDGLGTLNVSTAVSFVLAALGVPVAKHGNRALTSLSGAMDVISALGIEMPQAPSDLSLLLQRERLVFLAAPHHHPAMRHVANVRRTLGFRTIFNLLGPLSNPAAVRRQMIGVFDDAWLTPIVQTLGRLGSICVWALHGTTERGGIDEITLAGETRIVALDDGRISRFTLTPEMAGLSRAPVTAITGGDPMHNASRLLALLQGEHGAYRDTVLLNAAMALHVSGRCCLLGPGGISLEALRSQVARAGEVLDNGAAFAVLSAMRASLNTRLSGQDAGIT